MAQAEFIRVVRTDLFARVPASMRKMNLSLLEELSAQGAADRAFEGFVELV